MLASASTIAAIVLAFCAAFPPARAEAFGEESMTCEIHAGTIRGVDAADGGPWRLIGFEGEETIEAPGTCVVEGSDPSNPAVYDARISDRGYVESNLCGSWMTSEASWWTGGSVSIQLYDSTGAQSAESATGEWRISWGLGTAETAEGVHGFFNDAEGDTDGVATGSFQVRGLDQLDCDVNAVMTGRGSRQLTFDGFLRIDYP